MDLVEKDQAYEMSVELPGIRKDGTQVSIYENHVTVNTEAREEKEAGSATRCLNASGDMAIGVVPSW